MPSRGCARFRVVVAGSGVAGIEALLALRDLARDRTELTVVDPGTHFVLRAMATAAQFGPTRVVRIPLERIARDAQARLVQGRLAGVDTDRRVALVDEHGELNRVPYDALLVAVGSRSEPVYQTALTWIPGLAAERFGLLLGEIEAGAVSRVAFVVPPGVLWPLPAYELALMTAAHARRSRGRDARIVIATPEHAPLELFGAAGSAAVQRDLQEAGIDVETGAYVEERERPPRFVARPGERVLDAERVVALPRQVGPALAGLPSDREGFIPVDRYGRVRGADRVFAAGDVTSFPIKQGGIAAQQADAAARTIAHLAGAEIELEPFRPILRGILLTGRAREWMRHDVTGSSGEATVARYALWWPPTKVSGSYLSPYLDEYDQAAIRGREPAPSGQPVELDLELALPRVPRSLAGEEPHGAS